MSKLQNRVQTAILWLIFVFIVCEHTVRLTSVKNISLYTALLLALVLFFKERAQIWERVRENFRLVCIPATFIILFCVYAFWVSAFPYEPKFNSLAKAFSEFGRGLAFLVVMMIYANGERQQTDAFFYSILVAFLAISIYYAAPIFTHFDELGGEGEFHERIIRRAYADYVDRFLAFGLVAVVVLRRGIFKILAFLLCFAAVILDILSGTRGSWLSMICSMILFLLFLCFSSYRQIIMRNLKRIAILFVISLAAITIIALSSSTVVYKILQSGVVPNAILQDDAQLNEVQKKVSGFGLSSGRDVILKERLPLLFASPRAFIGLGHGKAQYDEFLRDETDKGAQISLMQQRPDGERYWFNDEPFFVGYYYYYGAFGTAMLFGAFVSMLVFSFRAFGRTQELLFAAVFISLMSYFGVRGLFEAINLRILYLFYMLGFLLLLARKFEPKERA